MHLPRAVARVSQAVVGGDVHVARAGRIALAGALVGLVVSVGAAQKVAAG